MKYTAKEYNPEIFEFDNKGYKPEWIQGEGYEEGTAVMTGDGSWTVYDGRQNYMGKVKPDGTFVSNGPGEPDEYEITFLEAALETIREQNK